MKDHKKHTEHSTQPTVDNGQQSAVNGQNVDKTSSSANHNSPLATHHSPLPSDHSPLPAQEHADKIEQLQADLKKEQDGYLRLRAEFDNFRKRVQQEKEDIYKFAAAQVLAGLIPIVDNFERAQQSFEKHHEEVDEIIKGVALIHKQLEDTLAKLGVTRFDCLGKPFDPQTQEAIMHKEVTEGEDNVVLEVVQQGYNLDGKVLRHAMVVVSKKAT